MRVLNDLLQTAELPGAASETVLRLMDGPDRCYHGLKHLRLLWSRHCRFSPDTEFAGPDCARLVACAIAFHDAILDPSCSDNEARSAVLWRQVAPSDLTAEQVDWVAATIEATANHLACTDASSQSARLRLWMLDLDLTPLGEPATVFRRNTQELRREYAHLSDAAWTCRHTGFLRRIGRAERIYRCPRLAEAFERQARSNIERALAVAAE